MKTSGKILYYAGWLAFLALFVIVLLAKFSVNVQANIHILLAVIVFAGIIGGSLLRSTNIVKTLVRDSITLLIMAGIIIASIHAVSTLGALLLAIVLPVYLIITKKYWRPDADSPAMNRMAPNIKNNERFQTLKQNGAAATATILKAQRDGGRGGRGNFHLSSFMNLTISFADRLGNSHTKDIRYEIDDSLLSNFLQGKEIPVLYDENNTDLLAIDTDKYPVRIT